MRSIKPREPLTGHPRMARFGQLARYAFAVAAVALALLATGAIEPLREQPPTLLFFAAVILTSWYAGLRAGFAAAILSMLALDFFFVQPVYAFGLRLVDDGVDFVAFAATTWLISVLQARWRRTHRRLVTIERDLEIGRSVQQHLFPASPPSVSGFEVAGACFPAEATGGDFFDYLTMPGGVLGIALGDVSGHGVGPALVMANVRAYLRALSLMGPDPGATLTDVDRLAHNDLQEGWFVTAFLAQLDPAARTLRYAGAGHEAHLVGVDGQAVKLGSTGLPIGLAREEGIASGPELSMGPGQILLLLSDGVLETQAADGTLFGLTRVLDIVRLHRDEPAATLVAQIHDAACRFRGSAAQHDDMTIVVVCADP